MSPQDSIKTIVFDGEKPSYADACRGKNSLFFRGANMVRFVQSGSGICYREIRNQAEAEQLVCDCNR